MASLWAENTFFPPYSEKTRLRPHVSRLLIPSETRRSSSLVTLYPDCVVNVRAGLQDLTADMLRMATGTFHMAEMSFK